MYGIEEEALTTNRQRDVSLGMDWEILKSGRRFHGEPRM